MTTSPSSMGEILAISALEAIKRATIEGRVCDDVAWFDTITTLHDYCDEALDRIRAAALRATPSWMPIETAPRDETLILVGNFREPGWAFFQHVVYWNDTDLGTPEHPWRISDTDQGIHKDYPTHWQPLPTPPSATIIEATEDGYA